MEEEVDGGTRLHNLCFPGLVGKIPMLKGEAQAGIYDNFSYQGYWVTRRCLLLN